MTKITTISVLTVILAAMTSVYADGLTAEEQNCFDAINEMRVKAGLTPFELNLDLSDASRQWSVKLHRERKLYHAHVGPENCARGHESGKATYQQWMNSYGHRALLQSRGIYEAGLGASGEGGQTYWTFRLKIKARERADGEAENRTTYSKKKSKLFRKR